MFAPAVLMFCCAQTPMPDPRVKMMQAYPARRGPNDFARSKNQQQAVILLQGLDLRDDGLSAATPRFQSWQGSCSTLVRRLAKNADVFAICYAQNGFVEDVAWFPGLRKNIARVKNLGYKRLILMGHSAGGLIARHFVEDFPKAGINAVIQIGSPNGGCGLADWSVKLHQVPRDQRNFISSMNPKHRTTMLASRRERRIPSSVEFVSVVTSTRRECSGDGVVATCCQWTRDLQLQRVPVVRVFAKHERVMVDEACINTMANLLSSRHPRWPRRQVFLMRQQLGFLPR